MSVAIQPTDEEIAHVTVSGEEDGSVARDSVVRLVEEFLAGSA